MKQLFLVDKPLKDMWKFPRPHLRPLTGAKKLFVDATHPTETTRGNLAYSPVAGQMRLIINEPQLTDLFALLEFKDTKQK